ncbi:MAG: hypothetical protein R6X06_02690, partial [Gammaproteobacteria bacterium]
AFREPKHVTLLGLGSGCLLQGLQAMPAPPRVAVVEHRQAVVDVARDYFWLPEAGNISVNVSDASAYLKRTAAVSTDIIFADLYTADEMNPLQLQKSFLRLCHRLLTEEGWLVLNFHTLPDRSAEFFTLLHRLYAEVLIYHAPDENYIIYAGKSRRRTSLGNEMERARCFPYNDKIGYDFLLTRIVATKDI